MFCLCIKHCLLPLIFKPILKSFFNGNVKLYHFQWKKCNKYISFKNGNLWWPNAFEFIMSSSCFYSMTSIKTCLLVYIYFLDLCFSKLKFNYFLNVYTKKIHKNDKIPRFLNKVLLYSIVIKNKCSLLAIVRF